jgi:iron complex outermembrane receptor protein
MKKSLLTITCFFSLLAIASAQTQAPSIQGKVYDNNKVAMNSASVSLLNAKDSSVLKLSISDSAGNYRFGEIPVGKYLLSATAVGFGKKYSAPIEYKSSPLLLEPITLSNKASDLKEVTVIARKPMIEQKIDRMIVNVDAAVTNAGSSALEVLEKSPGVQVDKDGNISLKGKQGVMVLIDGRPTYLTGLELANMLKGMQSSQLETIEIMTNPPAKYDAAGNSGVINIRTKKNKMKGFNGSISATVGQGFYFKTNESLNLNYRNGKFNVFGSYSFGSHNGFQQLDIHRKYKEEDGSLRAIFEQSGVMRQRRMNNNLKLGMDYNLTNKTTVGFVFSGFYNPESTTGKNTSYLKNPDAVLDSIVTADNYIKETWKNGSINMNLRHQYDSAGRELTADIDYVHYNASNQQHFTNTTLEPNWVKRYDEQLMGELPVKIDIYSAKMDYTHPLKNEAKLEMGVKSSYVSTDSKANYYELIDENFVPDYRKTNFFQYKENINAAYLNFNKQLSKKFGIQTGVRIENTNYAGNQYGNPTKEDSSFNRSYTSVFPTVYLSYKGDKNNQFSLSVGRRIDRPAYQDLNPFLFFIDKYTYGQGNPYLRPQYTNNIEASHIFREMLTTTINYSETRDFITETFDQPNAQGGYNYATIVKQGNIGKMQNAGIAVNLQFPVKTWLTSMIYTNYNYNKFEGPVNGEYIKTAASNLTFNVNNQLKFSKGWSGEVSGWYRTKGVEGQILIKPFGAMSIGLAKQVLKNKGSLKLNVRDVFYTQKVKGNMNFKSTEVSFFNMRDSRVANLTFTYRFGKPLSGSQPRKQSGVDEQSRVKGAE